MDGGGDGRNFMKISKYVVAEVGRKAHLGMKQC